MLKRLGTLWLTSLLALSLMVPVFAADVDNFTDVPSNAWYAVDVEYVTSHNLFNGTTVTTFSPADPMTRSMFVTVLARLAGVDGANIIDNASFIDIDFGKWYGPSVEWAYENGYINGIAPGVFQPGTNLTREQMAVIVYRFLSRLDIELEDDPTAPTPFRDSDLVSNYAKEAIEEMRRTGLIKGSGANVEPQRNITRAEAAAFLTRLDKLLSDYSAVVGVSISNTALSLTAGGTARLTAYPLPAKAAADVTWTSSDIGVVAVNGGFVTARAAGTATVTATAGNYSAQCTVKVLEKDDGKATFSVEQASFEVTLPRYENGYEVGETYTTTVGTITPTCTDNPEAKVSEHYSFQPSDDIIEVDEDGKMTLRVKMGDVDISKDVFVTVTHKEDDTTMTVKVTVKENYYKVDAAYEEAFRQELLRLVNETRRDAGSPELVYATELPAIQNAADARAEELMTHYGHNRPNDGSITDLQRENGVNTIFTQENIGRRGFELSGPDENKTTISPEALASTFHAGWLGDASHKRPVTLKYNQQMVCGIFFGNGYVHAVEWFYGVVG